MAITKQKIRFNVNKELWDVRKTPEWPSFEEFSNMDLTDPILNEWHDEISTLVDYDPKFHPTMLEKLIYKFPGYENINKIYSQAWQDLFVLTMLNGKINGTFLEIGAAKPVSGGNNTFLLEKFGYTGISIDIDASMQAQWDIERPNSKFVLDNALDVDYESLLENLPNQIDYLQVDIDPAISSLEALKKLPHTQRRFSVITFETDLFNNNKSVQEESRQLLASLGYELIVENVAIKNHFSHEWIAFEDWYVDPLVIDSKLIKLFKNVGGEVVLPHALLFDVQGKDYGHVRLD
jgi:hypothetical protein